MTERSGISEKNVRSEAAVRSETTEGQAVMRIEVG
jgi:hypothetical protein